MRYKAADGRTVFVSDGISRGETWMTCYCKPGSTSTHRLKSPALPLRSERSQAEADLEQYAAGHGFETIDAGQGRSAQ
jgi:hypothetical protein